MEFHKICVLGLGYIGLPTASTFATHGLSVVGVDVNRRVVDVLRDGQVHIQEPGLRDLVQAAFQSGNLLVSQEPQPADAFVLAVPTPILADKRADMHFVTAAAEAIVPVLGRGNLVVLEFDLAAAHDHRPAGADPGAFRAARRRGLLPVLLA